MGGLDAVDSRAQVSVGWVTPAFGGQYRSHLHGGIGVKDIG